MRPPELGFEAHGDSSILTSAAASGRRSPEAPARKVWELVQQVAEVNQRAHNAWNHWKRRRLYLKKARLISEALLTYGCEYTHISYQFRANGQGFFVLVAFVVPPCGNRAFHVPYGDLSRDARAFVSDAIGCPYHHQSH